MKLNDEYFRIRTTLVFAPITTFFGLYVIIACFLPAYETMFTSQKKIFIWVLAALSTAILLFGYVSFLAIKTYLLDYRQLDKKVRKESLLKAIKIWIEEE